MLLLLAALACQTPAPPPPPPVPGELPAGGEVVATVNGNPITKVMVEKMKEQVPPQMRMQVAQMGDEIFVNQLADIDLLYREGLKRNLQNDDAVKTAIALAARNALADAAIKAVVEERTTDEALKTWYQEHLVQFAKPQRKLSSIVVQDEATADKVLADLGGGKAFADAAKEYSMDPSSKDSGGEIGWFAKTDMRGPMGEAIFNAEVGKAQKFNDKVWYILLVTEARDQAPFEDVKEQIKEQVQRDVAMKYVEELRTAAKIEKTGQATQAPELAMPAPGGAPPAGAAAPAGADKGEGGE